MNKTCLICTIIYRIRRLRTKQKFGFFVQLIFLFSGLGFLFFFRGVLFLNSPFLKMLFSPIAKLFLFSCCCCAAGPPRVCQTRGAEKYKKRGARSLLISCHSRSTAPKSSLRRELMTQLSSCFVSFCFSSRYNPLDGSFSCRFPIAQSKAKSQRRKGPTAQNKQIKIDTNQRQRTNGITKGNDGKYKRHQNSSTSPTTVIYIIMSKTAMLLAVLANAGPRQCYKTQFLSSPSIVLFRHGHHQRSV